MSDSTNKKPSRYVESRIRLMMDSIDTPREDREHVYMPVALALVYFPSRDVKLDPTESFIHKSGNFQLNNMVIEHTEVRRDPISTGGGA